jgi:hypothetical protein
VRVIAIIAAPHAYKSLFGAGKGFTFLSILVLLLDCPDLSG